MLNSFFNNGAAGAEPKESIRSLRFNDDDTAYLSKASFGTATDANVYTISMWVKHADAANGNDQYLLAKSGGGSLFFRSVGTLRWENSGGTRLTSSGRYYDNAAWMHILLVQSSSSSREVFVNGESVGTNSNNGDLSGTGALNIGANSSNASTFDGLIADVHFVDGQALAVADFTLYDDNGDLRPKDYTGSYGNNGFYLPFSDDTNTTTIAEDSSGNNNDFTANNISVTAGAGNDSLLDSPSRNGTDTGAGGEVFGNYATLDPYALPAGGVLENGNLDATLLGASSTSSRQRAHSTIATASGKWYFEATLVSATNATSPGDFTVGIASPGYSIGDFRVGTIQYRPALGAIRQNNSNLATGLSNIVVGDVIGIAYDVDNSTFAAYVNGVLEASVTFNLYSGPFRPFIVNEDTPTSSTLVGTVNFGQKPFAYTAPSGFKAICTANLTDPTIIESGTESNVVNYTGTGAAQSITGAGFAPDFAWVKSRAGDRPMMFNIIRGTGVYVRSDGNTAEITDTSTITSFDADGFSIGSSSRINDLGATNTAWLWYAGGSTVSNTGGTITADVRANATAGFSMLEWTGNGTGGATVGHGLGAAPEMIFVKRVDAGTLDWWVYHAGMDGTAPEDFYIRLNRTNGRTNAANAWNDTAPTGSVFSLGSSNNVNGSGNTYVGYAWTSIPGFSQFGSYTGNGSADGPFVNCTFRPAMVLIKAASSSGGWSMHDKGNLGYNFGNNPIFTDDAGTESTTQVMNLYSNGFQLITTNSVYNSNGSSYIYAAWAEDPFKTALAR